MPKYFLFFLLFQFYCYGTYCYGKIKNIHINGFKKMWDNFHVVEHEKFYRSGQMKSGHLVKYIKKYGIKTVINLRGENENCLWWQSEKRVTDELDVNFYNLRFSAKRVEDKQDLEKLLYIYKTARRPILVHCLGGTDRTGEASALWVLEQQRKNKKCALKQFSLKYRYLKFRHPDKYFLVKSWSGIQNFVSWHH